MLHEELSHEVTYNLGAALFHGLRLRSLKVYKNQIWVRNYCRDALRTFMPFVGKGELRLNEELPFKLTVTEYPVFSRTLVVTVVHDEPMFVPWRFMIGSDEFGTLGVASVGSTPHPYDALSPLMRVVEDPDGVEQSLIDELTAAFQYVKVPVLTEQEQAARGLHAE